MNNKIMFNEILTVPPLTNFQILFGWKGKNKLFSNIIDSLSPLQTFQNSLVIISTDESSGKELTNYIRKVMAERPSAIILSGKEIPYISESISDQYEEMNIPVIYIASSLTIDQLNGAYQLVKTLKTSGQFNKYIESTVSDAIDYMINNGLNELIEQTEKRIGHTIHVTDPFFQTNYFRDQDSLCSPNQLSNFKKELYNKKHDEMEGFKRVILREENKEIYFKKLQTNLQQYGYLIIEQTIEKVVQFDLVQVNKITSIVIAELINQATIVLVEKKYQKNFIYDLLHNNFDSQYEIINQARVWGWDLTVPHQLLLLDIRDDQGDGIDQEFVDQMELIIRNTMSAIFYKPFTVELNGKYVVIFPDTTSKSVKERKEDVKKLANLIKENISESNPNMIISIGIGRYYSSVLDLCRSFQEAKTALELSILKADKSQVNHFQDLGVVRLLSSIRQEQLDDYCYEYLYELIKYDKENQTDMVETIQIYLNGNKNLKSSAEKLFIHTNTLRYRLKKIESVLQIDLQNTNDLLNLLVTLKIYSMNAIRM